MALWLLRPLNAEVEDGVVDHNQPGFAGTPWDPWPDCVFGFVVRASSEQEARQLASNRAGDETVYGSPKAWIDPSFSSCVPLDGDGPPEIIMRDFHRA